MKRPIPLLTSEIYHIYNKSIYGYQIFNSDQEYQRMLQLAIFYQWSMPNTFSVFVRYTAPRHQSLQKAISSVQNETHIERRVTILAYCLMSTHIHFVLEQNSSNGIERFMRDIQGAYSQYFNFRHNRKGPLWQNRFGNRVIKDDLGLIRAINYVHANPFENMGQKSWPYSSLKEYLADATPEDICQWEHRLALRKSSYQSVFDHYTSRGCSG